MENVLGDGPSRNPKDRDEIRNLRIPSGPVRRIMAQMFRNPEGLDKELEEAMEALDPVSR